MGLCLEICNEELNSAFPLFLTVGNTIIKRQTKGGYELCKLWCVWYSFEKNEKTREIFVCLWRYTCVARAAIALWLVVFGSTQKNLVPAPAKKKYPPMSLFDPLTLAM